MNRPAARRSSLTPSLVHKVNLRSHKQYFFIISQFHLTLIMVEQPVLRSAPTDGDGPAKRKRRPALSCVECRVRKVKCDRNKPCEACTRIKSATCTYRPHRTGICSQSDGSPGTPFAAARSSRDQDYEVVPRSSTKPPDTYSENDVTIKRFTQIRHPGEFDCSTLDTFPVDKPTSDPSSHSDAGSASIISSLLDRIGDLESKLAGIHVGDRSQGGDWESSGPVAGRFIKSKCMWHLNIQRL